MFIFKKDYVLNCNIGTEGVVTPGVFSINSRSGNTRTRRIFSNAAAMGNSRSMSVKIKVDSKIAKQVAEELGAVITAVNNGEYDS